MSMEWLALAVKAVTLFALIGFQPKMSITGFPLPSGVT